MAIAITLLFDDALERTLTDATQAIHDRFGGLNLLGRELLPHVTLASYDDMALDAGLSVLEGLLTSSPLPVQLASAGSFGGDAGVVFLAPVVTPRLLELHARIHAGLEPHVTGSWPHYVPGSWVPHVTLGHGVTDHDIGAALAQARALPLQLSGTAEALWVIEADAESEAPVRVCARLPIHAPSGLVQQKPEA